MLETVDQESLKIGVNRALTAILGAQKTPERRRGFQRELEESCLLQQIFDGIALRTQFFERGCDFLLSEVVVFDSLHHLN